VDQQGAILERSVSLAALALRAYPIAAGFWGLGRLRCHILEGFYVVRQLAAVTMKTP
jgi:hypothetical protein